MKKEGRKERPEDDGGEEGKGKAEERDKETKGRKLIRFNETRQF